MLWIGTWNVFPSQTRELDCAHFARTGDFRGHVVDDSHDVFVDEPHEKIYTIKEGIEGQIPRNQHHIDNLGQKDGYARQRWT